MLLAIPEVPFGASALPTFGSKYNMTSTLQQTASIVDISKAGTITKIVLALSASNVGNVYTVQLQTVDTGGEPSGTLWGTGTEKTGITGLASGSVMTVVLDSPATVAVGDTIAIVLSITTHVGTASWNGYNDFSSSHYPSTLNSADGGANWSIRTAPPTLGLEYSDGSYPLMHGVVPLESYVSLVLTTSSNPRIAGNRFRFKVGVRVVGLWWTGDNDADLRATLFGSDGSTVLATKDFGADLPAGLVSARTFATYFNAPVELDANTDYFLMFEGLASSLTIYSLKAFSTAAMKAWNGGDVAVHATAESNAPAGVGDYTIVDSQQVTCGLLFDAIEIPEGGGSPTTGERALTFVHG